MPDGSYLRWPFFDDHHRRFATDLRAWAADAVPPLVDHGDVDASCRLLVAALGEAGWLRATVPASHGGLHPTFDVRTLCLARETLAYRDGLADFAFAMQGLGSGPVSLFGSDELKRRVLPAVAGGKSIAAFALSEPEAGSDVAALATAAVPDGPDHIRLNGAKTWISNGGIADFYVVFARTGEAPGARGLSAFLVEADAPGLVVVGRIEVIAPHPLATLRFEGCRVPQSQRIGGPGEGFKIAMATLDVFRSTVGAAALGFARRALDEALDRAGSRRLFGAPLSDLQLTQAALAEMATAVDTSALLVYRAAWTKDGGAPRVTREAAMAKMHATEAAQGVIDKAVQIFGGLGVTKGVKVEELYREIRALRIYEGATEVQKIVIARELMRQSSPLQGEGAERSEAGEGSARNGREEGLPGSETAATAHLDTFARDSLPPRELWPDLLYARPELRYPDRLNCVSAFLDRWVEEGHGDEPCLLGTSETLTYADVQERVNRLANVLVHRLGLVPGNRVLLRSANNPMMAIAHLAVLKAGGIVVATMPLLRAKEIAYPIRKARIALALCDSRLAEEMERARAFAPELERVVYWGSGAADGLEAMMAEASPAFAAVETAADDVCLIGFTSGTTGEPKGTMHAHRDMLAICDAYGRNVLRSEASDRFIGSPPLAFTFGLGGLVLFPLHVGASAVLLEKAAPDDLLAAIARHRATICFTAPTAYRAMLPKLADHDVSSLRKCVSAGEALPKATFEAWEAATGLKLMDGIGATEMLHIFIAAREEEIRPGATGRPVPGYEAKVIDAEGNEVPPGTIGRLAVRGPTGCRYLADDRQRRYVERGWNVTGDTYVRDEDGYFWYQARSDDMIVSAGYNIAGPEVEAALLTHPAVTECGVVGAPDPERGMVVKAFVVLRPDVPASPETARVLQEHVKAEIAPYKYPRVVEFVPELPKTQTGKLQRFELRRRAQDEAASASAGPSARTAAE